MSTLTRKLRQLGIVTVITLTSTEVASCVGAGILAKRGMMYAPPEQTNLAEYLAKRDPELGWPDPKKVGQNGTDAAGSRVVPAFPDPMASTCASIYGDSFAWGDEVDGEHAWGNVLSRRAGCRVANYGVVGYGPDQAYLRYVRNTGDQSRVVILTHLSENILRNLNRLRNLLAPISEGPALKPRFIIGSSGEIELVPLYRPRDEADLRQVMNHPETLEHEWFGPGGKAGVSASGFPYVLSVVRLFADYRVRAAIANRPAHVEFYEPNHPAHGLLVSAGIARAFRDEALSRRASPVIVLLPLGPDFIWKRRFGQWPYASLAGELSRTGVPFLDAGDRFEAGLKGADPCSLYVRCAGGHFNEQGYRQLAEYVYEWLEAKGKL